MDTNETALTVEELIQALDGYGLTITDDDLLEDRICDLNLSLADPVTNIDRWVNRAKAREIAQANHYLGLIEEVGADYFGKSA